MNLVGNLYPNGEFGVSVQRRYRLEPIAKRKAPTEQQRWWLAAVKQHGILAAIDVAMNNGIHDEGQAEPIGLSRVAKSHSLPRGSQGITSYGRRCVRNSAFLLEREYGTRNLSFFTFTIPTLSREEWKTVLDRWSEVIRYMLIYMRRLLKSAGLPPHIVYVIELQPKRTARENIPALHVHGLFVGKRRGDKQWGLTCLQLRNCWRTALQNACKLSIPEYSSRALENVKGVQKSASAYLAKYMSKGVGDIESVRQQLGLERLVPSWWGLSSSMRALLKGSILRIQSRDTKLLLQLFSSPMDSRTRCSPVNLTFTDGHSICVGWAGRLYGEDHALVDSLCRNRIQLTMLP